VIIVVCIYLFMYNACNPSIQASQHRFGYLFIYLFIYLFARETLETTGVRFLSGEACSACGCVLFFCFCRFIYRRRKESTVIEQLL